LILAVSAALEKKGFVESYKKAKKGRQVEIQLPSGEKAPRIKNAKRVSRLSKRMYTRARDIYPVRSGSGTAVLSTPKGVLLDTEARKANVGGEVLFEVW
jgi:small subunit ribosomal protein S8